MRKSVAAVALVTSAFMIGGCQSVSNFLAGKGSRVETASLVLSDYFAERIDSGKRHLEAGRLSYAIVAFRQAAYDSAHAGEAYNGLGIAYARLGRADLAQRYFVQAMAAEPADPRYSRNLARLQPPVDLQSEAVELATTTDAEAMPVAVLDQLPAQFPPAGSGLVRVSSAEVRLSGAPAATSAPSMSKSVREAPVRSPTVLAENSAPTASRVQAIGLKPRKSSSPVRVAMSRLSRNSRNTYPIHIELPQAK